MTDIALRHNGTTFDATAPVPGDKSLSHRALILAAMAAGTSSIRGLGPGRDIAATRRALGQLGVSVTARGEVSSEGVEMWVKPDSEIDVENSGTTIRLLAGALAGRPFRSTLTGDDSLRKRPMRRLVEPLASLGASVTLTEAGTAPLTVHAPAGLRGARADIAIASAQVRTSFSLAALQAGGSSTIDGPAGFRDHTERWLDALGLGRWTGATSFEIHPGPVPPARYDIPGDTSSAAFLWAAAALVPGAAITTPDVSLNPGRTGLLHILERMGAEVDATEGRPVLGDPAGTVRVRGRELRGTEVAGVLTVHALDELPLVAVLGAVAEGVTVIRDAAELRAKESDRIATTVAMVRALGGRAEPTDDGLVVVGTGGLRGGVVASHGDHRIAMAAATAATVAREGVTIERAEAADVSWPGFYEELERAWSSR